MFPWILSLFIPFRKVQPSYVYQPAVVYQVEARLGNSFLLKLDKAVQQEERVPRASNIVRDDTRSLFQECHKKTKPHKCNTCAEGPSESHASSLVDGSVSVGSISPGQLTLTVFSHGVLTPTSFHNLSTSSPTRFPELYLMFGYGSLHQILSVAGWSLSDNNWVGQWSVSKAENH